MKSIHIVQRALTPENAIDADVAQPARQSIAATAAHRLLSGLCVAALATLAACGGGGGGGESNTTTKESQVRNGEEAMAVARDLGMSTTGPEAMFATMNGQATKTMSQPATNLATSGSEVYTKAERITSSNCPSGGTQFFTVIDNNTLNVFDAGDSMTLSYTDCVIGTSSLRGTARLSADTNTVWSATFDKLTLRVDSIAEFSVNGGIRAGLPTPDHFQVSVPDQFSVSRSIPNKADSTIAIAYSNANFDVQKDATGFTVSRNATITRTLGTSTDAFRITTDKPWRYTVGYPLMNPCPTEGKTTIQSVNHPADSIVLEVKPGGMMSVSFTNATGSETRSATCLDLANYR